MSLPVSGIELDKISGLIVRGWELIFVHIILVPVVSSIDFCMLVAMDFRQAFGYCQCMAVVNVICGSRHKIELAAWVKSFVHKV
jgi:hypothetical protein